MGAPVPEDEQPRLGLAEPAGAVPRRPAAARPRNARRAEQPLDRHPTHREARLRLELLREVRGIQARILALRQGEDLSLDDLGEAPPRGPAPIAMHEGAAPLRAQPGEEPPDLPFAQLETSCGVLSGHPSLVHQVQDVVAMQLFLTHGDPIWRSAHRALPS